MKIKGSLNKLNSENLKPLEWSNLFCFRQIYLWYGPLLLKCGWAPTWLNLLLVTSPLIYKNALNFDTCSNYYRTRSCNVLTGSWRMRTTSSWWEWWRKEAPPPYLVVLVTENPWRTLHAPRLPVRLGFIATPTSGRRTTLVSFERYWLQGVCLWLSFFLSLVNYVCAANGRNEVTRDSRSHRSRLEMKRTSSEGKALDYDEPVKENAKQDNYRHPKAKTHVRMVLPFFMLY